MCGSPGCPSGRCCLLESCLACCQLQGTKGTSGVMPATYFPTRIWTWGIDGSSKRRVVLLHLSSKSYRAVLLRRKGLRESPVKRKNLWWLSWVLKDRCCILFLKWKCLSLLACWLGSSAHERANGVEQVQPSLLVCRSTERWGGGCLIGW